MFGYHILPDNQVPLCFNLDPWQCYSSLSIYKLGRFSKCSDMALYSSTTGVLVLAEHVQKKLTWPPPDQYLPSIHVIAVTYHL